MRCTSVFSIIFKIKIQIIIADVSYDRISHSWEERLRENPRHNICVAASVLTSDDNYNSHFDFFFVNYLIMIIAFFSVINLKFYFLRESLIALT